MTTENTDVSENADEQEPGRWTLIRDVAVFQVKLLLDGFRDLILVPISLVTGVISLVNFPREGGSEFYDLLRLGRRSEIWINLFGAVRADRSDEPGEDDRMAMSMDEVVAKLEAFVVDEYRKGGVTAQAKSRLDKALDSLQDITHREHKDKES